ncbi:glutaredoxin-like protein [Thermogladius calderae 1633]|uniref:Glutaredoxin-like protein n=1 Tax=Thermogladius calderae (strain DSM 22663 / VKM B-2946 / 1633) TaxID=1184251 RepID=I3TEV3_THEC1|nr:thioredoxin family protein [Thermogladius calderae]AFK51291.1 glutaredoxin-like protein [Thermogladius calderae 1633]
MSSHLFDEETEQALKEIFKTFSRPVKDYLVVLSLKEAMEHTHEHEHEHEHHHHHHHAHFSLKPAVVEECPTCGEAWMLATELSKISNGALSFEIVEKQNAKELRPRYLPAFIYGTNGLNIRYYGLPSGQEFAPFIYVHQYIATGEVKLSAKVKEVVESIDTPLHVKIFVTPECPYCPIVVDYFNQIALLNKQIWVETIEALELPYEADMYGVQAVPYVTINKMEDYDEYGAEPVEVIPGYVPPEQASKVLARAERKLKRGDTSGKK